jgi:starvation-inducible DNA-binding protein
MKGSAMVLKPMDRTISELRVSIQPNIGLDAGARQSIVDLLNNSLANEALLTAKTRSARWNIRGPGFSELHSLYKTQYHSLLRISEEMAERTRMLGGNAIGAHQEFIDRARLEEHPGETPDILSLLADHEAVIRSMREAAKKCTEEYEDVGTSELLVSSMRQHEKMAWMLRSNIEPELTGVETFGSKN